MKKLFYLLITVLAISCKQKHFYSSYQSVDVKSWKSTDTLNFTVDVPVENSTYAYAVSVRHQKDYEFSNLWLKVLVKGNSIDTSFRFEVPLFKVDGKPYGKSSGSLCTQNMPLKTITGINKKGKYQISIIQLMRKDPLNGIEDIGLIIDKP
jgi:gliding motility-associated lipoprotein GldH